MKKILLVMLFIFSLSFVQANNDIDNNNDSTWTWDVQNCSIYDDKFNIKWLDHVKSWYYLSFTIDNVQDISWEVIRNKEVVASNEWRAFSYSFNVPWEVNLKASFNYKWCELTVNKTVHIYEKIISSLMEKKDTTFISTLWDDSQDIYYNNYELDGLFKNDSLIDMSDYVIINQDYVIPFLLRLWDLKQQYSWKKFVFLVSSSKWFFSRLIIPYIKGLDKEYIYVYDKENFFEVFNSIYNDKNLNIKNLLSSSNVWDKIYLPLSYFVNKLVESQLNIEILWTVLLTLFWTLVVAFFRQIIWFSVFWVYTPLIFAVLLITLWYKLALFLFWLSVLSGIITYFFTKKIYILYSAKISLHYIIYVILSIIVVWILITYMDFNLSSVNSSVILSFFIMPLLTKNIIKEDTRIFSKTFLFFILEFIVVTTLLLALFKIDFLKYILVAYPDMLWIFIVLVVLIGRFTWLQLLEYLRFHPLIKKSNYEEE